MTYEEAEALIREHTDYGGNVNVAALAKALSTSTLTFLEAAVAALEAATKSLNAAGASEGQAFDEWFDREYPLDDLGRRSKYQSTNVLGLMQAAWNARDAEIAALREQIAGMEKDAERLDWLDATNSPFKMGWHVGVAPAGNVAVRSIICLGARVISIREAIDTAKEKQG